MRKFLGTLVILGLLVAGVGMFRGWFSVSTLDQPDKTNVELRIDKERIKQDAAAASEKAHELTGTSNNPSDASSGRGDESAAEPK